jgi:ribonuclease J
MSKKRASEARGSEPSLHLVPLGGLGEVGMNCMAITYGDEVIVVDYGMTFPEGDMPGVNVLVPDPAWLERRADKIKALIITHGHEDHIGAVPWFLRSFDVPVYGPPMALGLLRHKLREREMLRGVELRSVELGEVIELSPSLRFEMLHVNHSMPDSRAVALYTPLGTVLHTGDWRFDPKPVVEPPMDLARFARLGDEGVLCLMADSTNVGSSGVAISESEVIDGIEEIMRRAPGRVLVTMFSSNIHRVQGLMDAAHALGRRVMLVGRSLQNAVGIAIELGRLAVPDAAVLIHDPRELEGLESDEVLILCTGSQGEPKAALTRIANGEHQQVSLEEDDVVIFSARVVPGNELAVNNVINTLWLRGIEVITGRDAKVHTSGHAYRPDMQMMLQLVRPQHFVPVHGDPQMLVRHARLAKEMGVEQIHVLTDGDELILSAQGARLIEGVAPGQLCIDFTDRGIVHDTQLKERRRMAFDGVVLAAISIDPRRGDIVAGPEVTLRGVVFEGEYAEVLEEARQFTLACFDELEDADLKKADRVAEHLKSSLRRFFRRNFDRKPEVIPLVLEVISPE